MGMAFGSGHGLADKNSPFHIYLVVSKKRITDLESEDQRAKNKQLSDLINQIKKSYKKSITVYQDLLDLKTISKNTLELDKSYASAVNFLVLENYASSEAKLDQLSRDIVAEKQKAMIAIIPSSPPIPVTNTPPSSGYARQSVKTDVGDFVVSLVAMIIAPPCHWPHWMMADQQPFGAAATNSVPAAIFPTSSCSLKNNTSTKF